MTDDLYDEQSCTATALKLQIYTHTQVLVWRKADSAPIVYSEC